MRRKCCACMCIAITAPMPAVSVWHNAIPIITNFYFFFVDIQRIILNIFLRCTSNAIRRGLSYRNVAILYIAIYM